MIKTSKKYLRRVFHPILIVMAVLFVVSCKANNTTIVQPSDTQTGSATVGALSGNTAENFKYLDVMYSSANAQKYNDQALVGEVYEKYRGKIQTVLNGLLVYPIQLDGVAVKTKSMLKTTIEKIFKMVITIAATNTTFQANNFAYLGNANMLASTTVSSGSSSAEWPSTVDPSLRGTNGENVARFINSPGGGELMTNALNNTSTPYYSEAIAKFENNIIKNRKEIGNYISQGGAALLGSVMGSSKGANIAAKVLAGGLGGLISGGPMGALKGIAGGLISSLFGGGGSALDKEILEKVKQIYEVVKKIEAKMETALSKLDDQTYLTEQFAMQQSRQGVEAINDELLSIMAQLVSLASNPTEVSTFIKNQFVYNSSNYNTKMQAALRSAKDYQEWYRIYAGTMYGSNNEYRVGRTELKKIKIIRTAVVPMLYAHIKTEFKQWNPPYSEGSQAWVYRFSTYLGNYVKARLVPITVNIKIPDIKYYLTRSLSDIIAMRNYSLERLNLIARAYSGNELLKKRADFAKADLNYILKTIKDDFNTLSAKVREYIKSNVNINATTMNNCLLGSVSEIESYIGAYGGQPDFQHVNMVHQAYPSSVTSLPFRLPANCVSLTQSIYVIETMTGSYTRPDGVVVSQQTFIEKDMTEIKLVDDVSGAEYVFNGANYESNSDNIKNFIADHVLNNPDYTDYIAIVGAIIAEWEIKLKAHVDAGAGL
jgi:hypothetical protein